jgi:hypothetical protein
MPERERMDKLEDLLHPALEKSGVATLVLVSTGEGLREWTYYTGSTERFMSSMNQTLRSEPPFPLEIHVGSDPEWRVYEDFKRQVRR